MVGLHRLFSSRSLTLACTIATVLLSPGGSAAAVLERRQDAETTTSTSSATDATTTGTGTAVTTTEDVVSQTSTATTSAATSTPTKTPLEDVEGDMVCDDPDVEVFCLPQNGTEVWPGDTYYVTWNPTNYPINSTITIELNYVNTTTMGGKSAYSSERTENRYGYVTIEMEDDWLQGHSRNNLTLYLIADDPTSDERVVPIKGSMISLVEKPAEHYPPPPPTPVPNKLGLMVGLPVSLGIVCLIAFGLCFGMRKRRQIGLGSIIGSRKKEYGVGKSRGQRMGGSRRENDAIRLGELDDDPARYTDDPNSMRRPDPELYHEERTRGEAFRPEVGRMKSWR